MKCCGNKINFLETKETGWRYWLSYLLPATKHDIRQLERKIMNTLDQVLQDVNDEATVIDSVVTLVASLQKQVADALANTNLPPDVQAKIDQVFAQVEANKAKLATAVVANTPAAPAA